MCVYKIIYVLYTCNIYNYINIHVCIYVYIIFCSIFMWYLRQEGRVTGIFLGNLAYINKEKLFFLEPFAFTAHYIYTYLYVFM